MAIKKYVCPPTPATGAGTFSDDLVGFQLVQGGGLTQGNFDFSTGITEKSNRNFITGTFSEPINLTTLGIIDVAQSKQIFENNFQVYPNFDLSQVTNFSLYGSLTKRISVSIQKIINYFPAAIESTFIGINYLTGATASNISYYAEGNVTTFDMDVTRLRNQFDIDFTTESTRNLELREIKVSQLRNLSVEYAKYTMYYNNEPYDVSFVRETKSISEGTLRVSVFGNPFPGQTEVYGDIYIRPNDFEVTKIFNESFDEVEKFLLNRYTSPIYTSTFYVPVENDDGSYSTSQKNLTWPLNGNWNIDILTPSFTRYIESLNTVVENIDGYKTNLISRFLTTGAFKEFDTIGQKTEKTLQIYGRSFDETKKFIDALAYMNSVNYNVSNDIPSQLLKNLAQTLGWTTNMSPITNDDFLSSVFGQKNHDKSHFSGVKTSQTPDELNYQYFRNLILNSAYLFKSKGTRKSVEILMRLIGAPEAIVEFNEHVYLADQVINLRQFDKQFAQISGGTYVSQSVILDPNDIYTFQGTQFTGFTTEYIIKDVSLGRSEFPMDELGYPSAPDDSESYFFQLGSGWFEQTPSHRGPEMVNLTDSTFVGSNPDFQTYLKPYTYGQDYLDRFRDFPFMDLGYKLTKTKDNNKSWVTNEVGFRANIDGGYNAKYITSDDRLVLNVKNIDLHMNPAQGLAYDVWYMSREFNYPIPNQGLFYVQPTHCNPTPYETVNMKMSNTQFQASFPGVKYPIKGGVDWTQIDPKPKRQTFFEFAQSFWKNMINVRNRQFMTNGKSMGYPTLESIYWKYLLSQEAINQPNNNFTYDTMIQYVNGLGDYWVRLVEQMIPATTIWSTGVKYENSVFHRQKHAWRRQRGCQIVPIPCRPCSTQSTFLPVDCPIQSVQCPIYPTSATITSFSGILGKLVTDYMTSQDKTANDCNLNALQTQWFVDLRLNDYIIVKKKFFDGVGFSVPSLSSPSNTQWYNGLVLALDELKNSGYDYNLSSDGNVVIYNSICSETAQGLTFKLNVGINMNLCCK